MIISFIVDSAVRKASLKLLSLLIYLEFSRKELNLWDQSFFSSKVRFIPNGTNNLEEFMDLIISMFRLRFVKIQAIFYLE